MLFFHDGSNGQCVIHHFNRSRIYRTLYHTKYDFSSYNHFELVEINFENEITNLES